MHVRSGIEFGILSGASREQAQPLLAPLYYIERALAPFAELAKSEDGNLDTAIGDLMKRNISILLLADIGTLSGALKERVDSWVKKGGVLVRFSGPRLEKGGDDILPAPLRVGGRTLGGALSWSTPQPLAAFTDDSLFAGLAVPAEVLVNRQVLAEPGRIGPEVKSWARLRDGTPLVTAAKRGDGQVVLFHVTANSDWSNLPLSGLFVEMLRRIATLGKAGGVSGEATVVDSKDQAAAVQADNAEVLPPLQVLDGFGLLKAPPPTAEAIPATKINDAQPSAVNPPGYYGPQSTPRALNLITPKAVLRPLPALPAAFEHRAYELGSARPLKPTLLGIALATAVRRHPRCAGFERRLQCHRPFVRNALCRDPHFRVRRCCRVAVSTGIRAVQSRRPRSSVLAERSQPTARPLLRLARAADTGCAAADTRDRPRCAADQCHAAGDISLRRLRRRCDGPDQQTGPHRAYPLSSPPRPPLNLVMRSGSIS